jgi:hypothetical protein
VAGVDDAEVDGACRSWRPRFREEVQDEEEAEGVRFHCSVELVGGHGYTGLASHPKVHARAKYGLVPTNYVVKRAVSYSFPLKAIELRT